MKWIHLFFISLFIVFFAHFSWAQSKKMDLDDITIKGEFHNDDRLKLLARQKQELKNFVKYRTDFRNEITEDLPKPHPKIKY